MISANGSYLPEFLSVEYMPGGHLFLLSFIAFCPLPERKAWNAWENRFLSLVDIPNNDLIF
jgi:hypothetical protein